MSDFLPPNSWEELKEQADKALADVEKMEKTPLPETVGDAMEEDFFDKPGDALAKLVGRTSKEELQKWNTRVMSLKDANAVLREVETELVRSYVLSPNSAFRIMYEGAIKIPRWLIEHTAEIVLLLIPLLKKGGDALADTVLIEAAIEADERALVLAKESISYLFTIVPGRKTGTFGDIFTAAELKFAIQEEEAAIAKIKREIADLTKLLRVASNYLEYAADAFLALLVWFSMEKLLAIAGTGSIIAEALTPARKLKDAAIEKAQKKAFPQYPQKRTVTYKRSRRN